MEEWWVYELRNAQAALEAALAIDRAYTPDEVTGLGVCSRQGPDERDHLYIAVCSKNPPEGRIHGVDEILRRFGVPSAMTNDELDEPRGRQWVASGPVDIIVAMLLAQHPGEIQLDWPEGSPRIYWAG
jgi:hypothetical protein